MSLRIGCLHTVESNVAVFDDAARRLDLAEGLLRHEVRNDLLQAAQGSGGLDAALPGVVEALSVLARDHDGVLLTCSTLGPAVDAVRALVPVPIMRVDDALARTVAASKGKVVVLCTVESTLDPTMRLIEGFNGGSALVQVGLVPGAWALFVSGDERGYLEAVAAAADDAYRAGADVVAFAQASMAPATAMVRDGPPPLTSPESGLQAMLLALGSQRAVRSRN